MGTRGIVLSGTLTLICVSLVGCAADSTLVENLVVMPEYFDTLSCPELVGRIRWASTRVAQLTILMEKSDADLAGPLVNAIAYNTEYARTRATQKYAEHAAELKDCDMKMKVDPFDPDKLEPRRR